MVPVLSVLVASLPWSFQVSAWLPGPAVPSAAQTLAVAPVGRQRVLPVSS